MHILSLETDSNPSWMKQRKGKNIEDINFLGEYQIYFIECVKNIRIFTRAGMKISMFSTHEKTYIWYLLKAIYFLFILYFFRRFTVNTLVNVNAPVVATTSWWWQFSALVLALKVKKNLYLLTLRFIYICKCTDSPEPSLHSKK